MLSADEIRTLFDRSAPMTVGAEEEVMLLDPATLDLAPLAGLALELLEDDPRFKPELPACQLEIVTRPCRSAREVAAALTTGRRDLAAALGDHACLAAAGAHPFGAPEGPISPGRRYAAARTEFGRLAHRQIVSALQVHVAVRPADRALAVYHGLRNHLPELAALAANAPFYAGEDTELASVRPKIAEQLPRQGVPPTLASWGELADAYAWRERSGYLGDWWWELRPHPRYGTIELRVPDAQSSVADAAAVVAVVHTLAARLAAGYDAGEVPIPAAGWRIAENRWSACRHGSAGRLADLETGEPRPTRERLAELIEGLAPFARELGCVEELDSARALAREGGAARMRRAAAGSPHRATAWLRDRFVA